MYCVCIVCASVCVCVVCACTYMCVDVSYLYTAEGLIFTSNSYIPVDMTTIYSLTTPIAVSYSSIYYHSSSCLHDFGNGNQLVDLRILVMVS